MKQAEQLIDELVEARGMKGDTSASFSAFNKLASKHSGEGEKASPGMYSYTFSDKGAAQKFYKDAQKEAGDDFDVDSPYKRKSGEFEVNVELL